MLCKRWNLTLTPILRPIRPHLVVLTLCHWPLLQGSRSSFKGLWTLVPDSISGLVFMNAVFVSSSIKSCNKRNATSDFIPTIWWTVVPGYLESQDHPYSCWSFSRAKTVCGTSWTLFGTHLPSKYGSWKRRNIWQRYTQLIKLKIRITS